MTVLHRLKYPQTYLTGGFLEMSDQLKLFNLPPMDTQTEKVVRGEPRLRSPQRRQVEAQFFAIDDLLPQEHIARTVWGIISEMDTTVLYGDIKARDDSGGRPATDPKMLLALWTYATLEGIGSARTLERYCREHHGFIWMCGGVSVNYHSLSDFRNQAEKLDSILVTMVAALIRCGAVSTETWAQDGMRVRASAGKDSYRKEESLQKCVKLAKARLTEVRKEAKSNPSGASLRKKSARERAAREQVERTEKAIIAVDEVRQSIDKRQKSKKEKEKLKKKARASISDPEARKMKMPNGGFDPAYNVQYVSDTKSKIITGVEVSTSGSDAGLMAPMLQQVKQQYDLSTNQYLVDGGYFKDADLQLAEELGIEVYMPMADRTKLKLVKEKERGAGVCLPADSSVQQKWLERMETEEGKQRYKARASTAEYSNASTRNKGFYQFKTRGLLKAKATSLIFAIAHNIQRVISMIKAGSTISFA